MEATKKPAIRSIDHEIERQKKKLKDLELHKHAADEIWPLCSQYKKVKYQMEETLDKLRDRILEKTKSVSLELDPALMKELSKLGLLKEEKKAPMVKTMNSNPVMRKPFLHKSS